MYAGICLFVTRDKKYVLISVLCLSLSLKRSLVGRDEKCVLVT
jgi:hypothetical protein